MAYKLTKKDKKELKTFSKKMVVYPLYDKDNKPITHQQVVTGYQVIEEHKRLGTTPGLIGDKPIKEDKKYVYKVHTMSDPYKYLLKKAEQGGPEAMDQALKDYSNDYNRCKNIIQTEMAKKSGAKEEQPTNDVHPG